ncbi:MAG: OmpH family outer membrane protein [Bryobacterales bacterium]|nr:OmpH family outer membrane protein [Bryobacterales bacterium]
MFRTIAPVGVLFLSAFAAGNVAFGQAAGGAVPNKVGIIHIQNAIIGTKDGQKAANELQSKFTPKKQEIDKKQREIESLRAQLSKGSALMSAEQKESLMRDIDQKTRALNRDTEDAQQELDQEQQRIMQELGQRVLAVIDKYSKDNGYSLILDISAQASPVVFAVNGIDITNDIVALYDQNSPGPVSGSAKPAKPAAPAAAAPAAAAK